MKLSFRVKILSTIAILLGLGLIALASWQNAQAPHVRPHTAAVTL